MKKLLLVLLFALLPTAVSGQVTYPFTDFQPGQIISSGESNANFAAIADGALNRTGGTITGHITVDSGITIDSADISIFLTASRVVAQTLGTAGSPAFSYATETGTGFYTPTAGQLAVALAGTQRLLLNAGLTLYGNAVVNASGKIPALTSTYFGSLDAQDLQPAETSFTDGSILARVAADETITGAYDFDFFLQSAVTWNNAAVTFKAFDVNVTDTTSAAGSKLVDWRVAGVTKASVDKAGKFVPVSVQATSGARNLFVLVGDANGSGQWIETASTSPVPAGMLAFFEAACPATWTRRAIYDDKFIRGGSTFDSVGGGVDTHAHTFDPPSTTSDSQGSHTHSVDFGLTTSTSAGDHSHCWGGCGSHSTESSGSHTHTVDPVSTATGINSNGQIADNTFADFSVQPDLGTHNVDVASTTSSSDGSHTHTVPQPGTTTDGAHTHTLDLASSSTSSNGAHTHTADPASGTSGTTSNVPAYIQVLVCKKD